MTHDMRPFLSHSQTHWDMGMHVLSCTATHIKRGPTVFFPRCWSPPLTSNASSRCAVHFHHCHMYTLAMYAAPHGGGSGGGLSRKKSHGEKNGCGGCDVCTTVDGCWVDLFGAFLILLGVLVADFLVIFASRGSGSWSCGFRLSAGNDDVPVGNPFMFHEFRLTAGGSGKLRGLSMSPSLAFWTACVAFSILSFSAAPS